MNKSRKLMGMADVHRITSRWFDERVKRESGAMMKTTDGERDFIAWLREQTERLDLIYKYQWGRVMFQRGFRKEKRDNDWYFPGIKLK